MPPDHIVVAYVPVLHKGYLKFFRKHRGAVLYILGRDFLRTFAHLERDIRALSPEEMQTAISSYLIFKSVRVLEFASLPLPLCSPLQIIMPDEDVSREIARLYFSSKNVIFEPIFLRWDMKNTTSEKKISSYRVISQGVFELTMMGRAFAEAQKSPDWWRQIGALAVKDGEVLVSAFNKHMPHQQSLYALGDPRGNFSWGEKIELSNSLHAEQGIIAQAARKGISMEGAYLYVTTFPCPECAMVIAEAGFTRVYYREGYSRVGAEEILRSRDVEIICVYKKSPVL